MLIPTRVAGESQVKISAVKAALIRLGHWCGEDSLGVPGSKSGVPEQPWSPDLGDLGANNRAKGAVTPGHYTVGIENFIDADGTKEDYAVATIITPSGHKVTYRSVGVPVPPELIELSRESGWTKTCGKFEAERTPGLDHANPHPKWSGGTMDRAVQLVDVLMEVFTTAIAIETRLHHVTIAGCKRELPVGKIANDTYIAILELAGDAELTEECGKMLAALMPDDVEAIIMPYGKALPLLHVVQRETGLQAVVARKNKAGYLPEPVIETPAASITSGSSTFYLGADKANLLRGKKVAFLDDVVSRRGTLKAILAMLADIGVREIVIMAVATEGIRHEDVTALTHLPVFFQD